MKISSINTGSPYLSIQKNFKGTQNNNKEINNITSQTASTFALWFGFGIGLDFLSRKIHFSKSPAKNSFVINGILATVASIYVLRQGLANKQKNKD